jgi:tetratricopeptide (TPR) repeat protein
MSDVFISHVKEDSDIAQEIARGLEAAGYTTWYYERNGVAGVSYLLTTKRAIEESRGVLVIISVHSLASQQMTKEVVRAHESDKPFIPVLRDITHDEFQQRQPEWREAMGAAASLDMPPAGASAILPRIIDGLKTLGIHPKSVEERAVEARARERTQRLETIRRQADQAAAAGDWDKAVAALGQYVSIAPENAAMQARLLETRQWQRKNQLAALRVQAVNLAQAEKWEQALSAWRAYLALEPEDKAAAQAELQQAEKLRAMAGTYAEAQAALAKKDYDRAISLLKGLVVQDETYKQASRLLAKAIELRRGGGRPDLSKWLSVGLAGVALVALALVLARVLPSLVGSRPKAPPSPTAIAGGPTAAVTPVASAVAQASPTRVPAAKPTTPSAALKPKATVTPQQPPASPTPSSANAVTAVPGSIWVPDAVVGQFFSPGPDPGALAVASDALWVWDDDQRLLYKLDRIGNPLGAFPITFTETVLDLAWDGAALRLTLDNSSGNPWVVRLDSAGKVLESFVQPMPRRGSQAWSPADGTVWELRSNDFALQFSADGRLLQSFQVNVWGGAESLACAADGLWVIGIFGDCYRIGFDGAVLNSTKLNVGKFPYQATILAPDERGYIWLIFPGDRKIYQLSLRQLELPPTPTPAPATSGELALPRPQVAPATASGKAIVHVQNNLAGTMTLSFGEQSAILYSNDTWSAELEEGAYTVFASTNVPEPIAFSGTELVLEGYEYTWILQRPEGLQLEPTPVPPKGSELPLPPPEITTGTKADKVVVHLTNNLGGVMTLSFGGQSAIVNPNDTWSAEVEQGSYTVFASANVPEPIAFSGSKLLVAGYEYTWVLQRPE